MNTKMRENNTKDIFLELLAVAFLATGGIFVKYSSLSPINTGFYRVLFSLPLLFPLAYKNLKELRKKDVCILFLLEFFLLEMYLFGIYRLVIHQLQMRIC